MKKLIIINGTMGVGKTTVCRELYQSLERSVWLDADWCWMMNPFVVTEENKKMVEANIAFMLRSFLNNSSFDYVVFNWVIHKEAIFDVVLEPLKDLEFQLYKISLVCTEEALADRIKKDGRSEDVIVHSIERLKQYQQMNTIKLDTTHRTVNETVKEILHLINN